MIHKKSSHIIDSEASQNEETEARLFGVFLLDCLVANDFTEQEHKEFWEEVKRSYQISLRRIPLERNLQRRQAKELLAEKGWADVSYFRRNLRSNGIYEGMAESLSEALENCGASSDNSEATLGLVFMENRWKNYLYYDCPFPEKYMRFFVLYPPLGKSWILRETGDNVCEKVLVLAIHFPTIFPIDVSGEENENAQVVNDGYERVRRLFMGEIRVLSERMRGLVFSLPPSKEVADELDAYLVELWEKVTKVLLSFMRDEGRERSEEHVQPSKGAQ